MKSHVELVEHGEVGRRILIPVVGESRLVHALEHQLLGIITEAIGDLSPELLETSHNLIMSALHVHDPFPGIMMQLEQTFSAHELPEVFVCANDFYVNYTIEAFALNWVAL